LSRASLGVVQTPQAIRVSPSLEQEWPGSSASATEVVINLVRAGDVLTSRVDALCRAHGLPSSTAMIVLEVLRGAEEPLQPSTVAQRCFLSRPALSSVMDTLERRGYLSRSMHTTDRRRVQVSITDEGLAVMERLLPVLHRAEADWIAPVSPAERERLLGVLADVQARLANGGPPH
jgi:DNA-binding MarR family transcriptional regulator